MAFFLFILSSSCVYYLLSYFLFFSFLFILFYFFSLFFIGSKAQILAQFGLKMQPTIASNSPTAKAQLPGQHKPKPAAFFFPSRVKHLPAYCFPFLPRARLARLTPHVVFSFNHQTTPAPFQDKKEDTPSLSRDYSTHQFCIICLEGCLLGHLKYVFILFFLDVDP